MVNWGKRLLLLVAVSATYFLVTLHLLTVPQDCNTDRSSPVASSQEEEDYRADDLHLQRPSENRSSTPASSFKDFLFAGLRGPLPKDQNVLAPEGSLNHLARKPRKSKPTTRKPIFSIDLHDTAELLDPNLAPNTVFFVWCGNRWFEFHHYLSVLSVIKEIRPDNIVFFYDIYPVLDYFLYNTWLDELKDSFPFFEVPTV